MYQSFYTYTKSLRMGMQLSIWNLHVQSIIHREFYHDSVYIANEGHYISTDKLQICLFTKIKNNEKLTEINIKRAVYVNKFTCIQYDIQNHCTLCFIYIPLTKI